MEKSGGLEYLKYFSALLPFHAPMTLAVQASPVVGITPALPNTPPLTDLIPCIYVENCSFNIFKIENIKHK